MRDAVPLRRIEHDFGGCDIVSEECVPVGSADLRLKHDNDAAFDEVSFPRPRQRQVDKFSDDTGVQHPGNLEVRLMLVEHHNVVIARSPQARNEVLAHEPRTTRKDDPLSGVCRHQMSSLLKMRRGRWRMIIMISAQRAGA